VCLHADHIIHPCEVNVTFSFLRQRRIDRGALTLASPEVRFELESETHDPVDVAVYEHFDTHELVEEFMLLANISVAKRINQAFPRAAVLRRHPAPSPAKYVRGCIVCLVAQIFFN
jgi:exosome complex exonuclease DIS3/RRP44